jgi:hypothetical protein
MVKRNKDKTVTVYAGKYSVTLKDGRASSIALARELLLNQFIFDARKKKGGFHA